MCSLSGSVYSETFLHWLHLLQVWVVYSFSSSVNTGTILNLDKFVKTGRALQSLVKPRAADSAGAAARWPSTHLNVIYSPDTVKSGSWLQINQSPWLTEFGDFFFLFFLNVVSPKVMKSPNNKQLNSPDKISSNVTGMWWTSVGSERKTGCG